MSPKRSDVRVAIVGAGVMAEAMIAGLLANRAVAPDHLVASHPRRDRRELLSEGHGISVVARNAEAVRGADIAVLAVKPQMLARVMRDVGPALTDGQVVLSIVAGATLRTLTVGLDHPAVVRAMPNTPSQIRRGIAVWAASSACTSAQRELARRVLRAIGHEKEVADEAFVAMATALSGTGPTYLFAV
ncbi:MAG TPA: NAD(P)-binding domain-containing protein, partial [Candidatus Limnocylindria bacterium]